jgi:hypothetical protein
MADLTRDQLVEAAKKKWEREQLIEAAKAKWASENSEPEEDISGAVETGARGLAEGMTLGLSEPVISSANAVIGNLIDAGFDSEGIKDFLSKAVDRNEISNHYDQDVDRRRGLKKEYPYVQAGTEIVGAIASPANKALGAVGKAAGMATEALPGYKALQGTKELGGVVGAATGVPRALARTAKAGTQGAAVVTAAEGAKRLIEGTTGFIKPEDQNASMAELAAFGGKVGSGMHAGIGTAKAAFQVGGKVGQGILAAIGGVKPEIIKDYLKKGSATRDALSPEDAKVILDEAISNVHETVKGKRNNLVDEVISSLERLKQSVNKQSEEAYEILEKYPDKEIHLPNMKRNITLEKKSLQPIPGKPPIGSASKAAVAKLDGYREVFDQYPKKITLSQAKMILQQMDHDIKEVTNAGGYGTPSENAIRSIRYSLDSAVKKLVPEYERKMIGVADDTRALVRLSEKFGTPEKVMSKIDRFKSPSGDIEFQALQELERRSAQGVNRFGEPLEDQVGLFHNPNPLSGAVEGIHEAKPIMRLNPDTTQSFMQSIFHGSIQRKQTLQLLSRLEDQDLVSLVENTGIKDAFTKQFNAGSANINFWTVLGSAATGAGPGVMSGNPYVAGAGAVLGALVKFYGPSTTKMILDGVSQIKGAPTVRKIDQYLSRVPKEVRDDLKLQLMRAAGVGEDQNDPVVIPSYEYKQTLFDIDGAKNLNNIEKAKAIDSLNRSGKVDSKYLNKVIVDQGIDQAHNKQISYEEKNNTTPVERVNIDDVVNSIRTRR